MSYTEQTKAVLSSMGEAELDDEEMYCSDATWSGIYDQMHTHTVLETTRRLEIAVDFGEVGVP